MEITIFDLRGDNAQFRPKHGDYTLHDYGRGVELGQVRNGRIWGVPKPPFNVKAIAAQLDAMNARLAQLDAVLYALAEQDADEAHFLAGTGRR